MSKEKDTKGFGGEWKSVPDGLRWESTSPAYSAVISTVYSEESGITAGLDPSVTVINEIEPVPGKHVEEVAWKPYNKMTEEDIRSALDKIKNMNVTETSWIDDMMGFSVSNQKKPGKYSSTPYTKVNSYNGKTKKKIDIVQAIEAIDELVEKDIANFVITGSVGLFLQGKISRKVFSDIDLICSDEFQFDDDMSKMTRQEYEKNEDLGEMSCFVMNSIIFDVFKFEHDHKVNTIEVEYNGKTYLCQDYRDIIMAKFNMIAPRMKDYKEIFHNVIQISFK